jgi:CheY-specific phosphatase CheX
MGEDANEIEPVVLEAFQSAVQATFEQLTQTSFDLIRVSRGAATLSPEGFCASLELLRPAPGLVSLELAPSTLTALSNRLFPDSPQLTREMQEDALREFLNVIAGQAKTALKGTPYHYHLSLPKTDTFDSTRFPPEAFTIQFVSPDGPLLLTIFLPSGDQ